MAPNTFLQTYISPEEYLERERLAFEKSEYYNGEIFPMSGPRPLHAEATSNLYHARIKSNVHGQLFSHLRGKRGEVFHSDLGLNIPQEGNLSLFPDISVVIGKAEFTGTDTISLLNPTLLVEIMSKSTAEYDRTEKFAMYRQIESLQEYVLINQNYFFVEAFF